MDEIIRRIKVNDRGIRAIPDGTVGILNKRVPACRPRGEAVAQVQVQPLTLSCLLEIGDVDAIRRSTPEPSSMIGLKEGGQRGSDLSPALEFLDLRPYALGLVNPIEAAKDIVGIPDIASGFDGKGRASLSRQTLRSCD